MNWSGLFLGRDRDDWRPLARGLILISVVVFATQIHNFMRIQAFETQPHSLVKATGRLWRVKPHRGPASLLFDAGHGQVVLSCETPTILCTGSANTGDRRLADGKQVDVAWIDGPAGVFSGTAHYPISIEQAGHLLLEGGPADIAAAYRSNLGLDMVFIGVPLFVLPLLALAIARKRDQARLAALSAAWRRRHESANKAPELGPPGSASR